MKLSITLLSIALLCVQGALAGPFTVPVYYNVLFDPKTGEGGYPVSKVVLRALTVADYYIG